MNLRFPEVFGFLLFLAFLCSFGLPRSVSGRVENSFQFVFAPVTGPIQWMTSNRNKPAVREPTNVVTNISDEASRLREENAELTAYVETLRGQIETLGHRQTEAQRVGEKLQDLVLSVKVIGVDGAARDVLRLAGTSAGTIERDQPVIVDTGLVGRILDVGLLNQASVRLITDKGFKLIGKFGRYVRTPEGGVQLAYLPLDPTVLEGLGNGSMVIKSLKTSAVTQSGLKVNDLVLLSDESTSTWPIEVHGYRVGIVTSIGESIDTPGLATIIVKPEANLLTLKDVMVVVGKK